LAQLRCAVEQEGETRTIHEGKKRNTIFAKFQKTKKKVGWKFGEREITATMRSNSRSRRCSGKRREQKSKFAQNGREWTTREKRKHPVEDAGKKKCHCVPITTEGNAWGMKGKGAIKKPNSRKKGVEKLIRKIPATKINRGEKADVPGRVQKKEKQKE